MSSTVRISSAARDVLREMARDSGRPMQAVLEEAIEAYRRQRFIQEVNRAYARLAEDPEVWAAEAEEREAWESTLADGLDEL